MLTVKWVIKRREGEITRIFPASSVSVAYPDASIVSMQADEWLHVSYAPSPDGMIKLGKDEACLLIDPDDERTCRRLTEGTCYVVNEQGRTVGTYRLDDVDVNGPSGQQGVRSSKTTTYPGS